jgi:hypothetical protein
LGKTPPDRAMPGPLPSTSLYFLNACAPLVSRWWELPGLAQQRPIARLSANCFATRGRKAGGWMVLVRRDSPAMMARALRWPGRLAYVVDDDIAGAAESPSLPAAYRARLDAFEWDWHAPLLARADVVLAASDVLAERLARRLAPHGTPVRRINPVWHAPPADTVHFDALQQGAPFQIVHLGTASHAGALARLAPVLARVLCRHASARLTYVAPRGGYDSLADLPGTRRIAPRSWPAWQRWLAGQRFHLALYPLLDEAFDRARSSAKLWEHAQVGAAGLYPTGWAGADLLEEGALRAGNHPDDWGTAIERALAAPLATAQAARLASSRLKQCKFCAMQQDLWIDLLGL